MIDNALLSFAFVQGVLAFFAPCAVSLLPGYLANFVTKKAETQSKKELLLKSLKYSCATIGGILTIYGLATILILTIKEIIKSLLVYISLGLGVIITIFGLAMFFGKTVSFTIKSPKLKAKGPMIEAYIFGITFGIGVLGCLFPFFLAVAVMAMQSSSIIAGATYLGAYMFGMCILMVIFYILAQFAKAFLYKMIQKIVPYLNKVGGALIVIAGIYIIWYQSALL